MDFGENQSGFPGIDEGDHNLVCRLIRDEARAHIALQAAADGEQPYTGPCGGRPFPAKVPDDDPGVASAQEKHKVNAAAMGIGQCIVLGLARVDFEGERILWCDPIAGGLVPWTVEYNAILMEHFSGVLNWTNWTRANREQFRVVIEDPDMRMN
jgi:hypothetical protein